MKINTGGKYIVQVVCTCCLVARGSVVLVVVPVVVLSQEMQERHWEISKFLVEVDNRIAYYAQVPIQ